MKSHHLVLLCSAFISIFCTEIVFADKVHIYTSLNPNPSVIHFSPKGTVELHCNASDSGQITWERAGKAIPEISDLKNRYSIYGQANNTLVLKDLKESDVGNYSCVISGGDKATISLSTSSSAKWGVRVTRNVNVVEGEKLTIKCEIRGDLKVEWWYENTTSGENATKLYNDERIKLSTYYDEDTKMNVTDGELKILEVNMGDRGKYTCIGRADDGQEFNATSTVRIKDKYAALWPFLGICAEVFILCAIIFIYEKKRNKTELEESDTDQSPDQKNTPDHGKESNLRHRQ